MMKFAVLSLVLAVASSAPVEQSHGATSFVSLNLGGKAGYTQHGAYETTHQYQAPQVYHAAPQYHAAAPVYVQKYVAPVVAKVPVAYKHVEEEYGPAEYEFKYAVEDKHTGDIKSQHETRHGDQVQGEYSFHEADGTIRTVKYTVDKHSGFNAVVERSGHAAHPQVQAKAVYASAPVAHGYYH